MYFADGFVRHVLFMAMVLWNRYIFVVMWWSQKQVYFLYDGLVKQVHFYGDDLTDGLVKHVYFILMTLLMVFWDMYILFMMVLLNSNIFVVMVFWHTYIFFMIVLWNSNILGVIFFWNRYIFFSEGLVKLVHFCGNGLLSYVHFPYDGFLKQVNFCNNGLLNLVHIFAVGLVEEVCFVAMVLWNRYVFCWWFCEACIVYGNGLVIQVHFYGDDLADGLVKQVYFMVITLLMVLWDMYIFFIIVLRNSNIFLVMVLWNRYIFFIMVLWN